MGLGLKLKNIIMIVIGSAIYSYGFVHFNMQNELGEGGFAGITLILFFVFKWDVALMNLLLNIPMFILGWKLLGRKVFMYTIIGTVAVSIFLKIFQIYEVQIGLQDDMFLVSLFAGVFVGVGLGIIFRFGGTTGGVDILARLGQKYLGWSMGKTMFMFDAIVILLSWLTFLDIRSVMYTLVAVFVGARVIDFVQEGGYAARGAFIISEHQDAIANRITNEMDRGVTVLKGYGHYTKKEREILYCVIAKNEIVRLKSIITAVDPHAFVSVTETNDVMGEGFTLDEEKRPID
ncbi:YitT family protein [Psychrobacillus lasiicapitis]|uniref:YitT family protein n=1 Tax=Psychrobacillus lasiicapitis TaxID=1636719 RepID=A0A544THL4_9BACI|nr:YitT family protein [Psychrobacillus lasiicapitis]TQR16955.1 YitT family protein [Psychrobacillus lasiicapitis]GGA25784.1 membrane protein [Psychrobacillus lasiicapitis]